MTDAPRCMLCRSLAVVPVEDVAFSLIWSQLSEQFGVKPEDAGLDDPTPSAFTTLWRCTTCSLGFFSPALPGNAGFYSALDRSGVYYHGGARWDTYVAARRVQRGAIVLDFGSGPGHFLVAASKRGGRPAAIELNPVARRRLSALGVRTFDNVEEALEAGFKADLVCAFQVVEHLGDLSILRSLVRVLAPQGLLIISVPNSLRLDKGYFEVLDVPPHHITQWNESSLRRLGEELGLSLQAIRKEPPGPRALVRHWISDEPQVETPPLNVPSVVRSIYWRLAGPVFSQSGLSGHSVMAEFKRH